jgi:tRNA pseudouridine55 synthase
VSIDRVNHSGWIVLDKPVGVSSAKAVAMVKKLIGAKKIGHGGTLDPLASGVLPLAVGEATKMCSYMLNSDKAYEFSIVWGEDRDTADGEGLVMSRNDLRPSKEEVINVIDNYLGEQLQMPPAYSAIKIGGKRACDLMRSGEDNKQMVNSALEPRKINIYDFKMTSYGINECNFYVHCSKGTYVRSIAIDLAKSLGLLGYVGKLHRVKSGKFSIFDAIAIETLAKWVENGLLNRYVYPIQRALDDIPALCLDDECVRRLLLGQRVATKDCNGYFQEGESMAFDKKDLCRGLVLVRDGVIHPKRMFVYS